LAAFVGHLCQTPPQKEAAGTAALQLFAANGQDLTAFVIAAGRTRLREGYGAAAEVLFGLLSADRQNLPPFVVTAGGAGDMRRNGAAALRAFAQLRGMPAICSSARAQPHFRSFTFWDSHIERAQKEAGNHEKANRQSDRLKQLHSYKGGDPDDMMFVTLLTL
jgi:hypothetical protein